MMDLSFWNQLNPEIIYEPTRKQFYGQYLCKLVIYCPGGKLIQSKGNLNVELAHRINSNRLVNYGGSWYSPNRNNFDLGKADVIQLDALRTIKSDTENVKFRVEEPYVQIYALDEETLKIIAARIPDPFLQTLFAIQFPESDDHTRLLKEDKILLKPSSKIGYRYKVILRDGEYSADTKKQILAFLSNLGDEAKLSKSTFEMLSKPYNYIWGCFVYVNDPGVLTFLNIISPGLVGKIHELTSVSQ